MKILHCMVICIALICPAFNAYSQVILETNPNFLFYNRYGVKFTVDHVLYPPYGYVPAFPMDSMEKVTAIRFSSQLQKTVYHIKLYSRITGSPGRVKVSLKDDNGNGLPTSDAVAESSIEQTITGWSTISLDSPKTLYPDKVYHIVVEPYDGIFDTGNHVEYITAISRMQIPFQPYCDSSIWKNHPDARLAFLFDHGGVEGMLVQRTIPYFGDINSVNPLFVIEFIDGTAMGEPYDIHEAFSIWGDNQYGFSMEVDIPVDINFVTMFTCREVSVPADHLYVDLFYEDQGSLIRVFQDLELIDKNNAGHIVGRAHWFSIDLQETVTLQSGFEYYFVLKSPASVSGEGYKFPWDDTSVTITNNDHIPTFDTVLSHAIGSTNGGTDYYSLGPHSDTGLILGFLSVEDKARPIAVFDEIYGFPKTCNANEVVELKITNRNIGSEGDIYAKIYDIDTLSELAYGIYENVSRNKEKSLEFSLPMPARDLKLVVECGHFNALSEELPDDGAFYEIRLSKEMALCSDIYSIPETTGGEADFELNAGIANANRNYLILGSVTGTTPGFPLPGGHAVLPLNWDPFTDIVLSLLNQAVFLNFYGQLSSSGYASAQLDVPPLPGFATLTIYFAFCLNNPFDFVSNPIAVEIVS